MCNWGAQMLPPKYLHRPGASQPTTSQQAGHPEPLEASLTTSLLSLLCPGLSSEGPTLSCPVSSFLSPHKTTDWPLPQPLPFQPPTPVVSHCLELSSDPPSLSTGCPGIGQAPRSSGLT